MSLNVEHNSYVVQDNRWFGSTRVSEVFEKAGGIIIYRYDRRIAIVRIAYEQVRELCRSYNLDYIGPILSEIEPSSDIKDITPEEPRPL